MKTFIVKETIGELNLHKGNIIIVNEQGVPQTVGVYAKSFPFIDLSNKRYFEPFEQKYALGECVTYTHKSKGVYKVSLFDFATKGYTLTHIDSDKIAFTNVSENKLAKADVYYFISSKGGVQKTLYGKDTTADKWRKLTNNIFKEKELADKWRNSILSVELLDKSKLLEEIKKLIEDNGGVIFKTPVPITKTRHLVKIDSNCNLTFDNSLTPIDLGSLSTNYLKLILDYVYLKTK